MMKALPYVRVKWVTAVALVLFFAASTGVFAAAVDYFLKIDGIAGESTDQQHANWIDVLSFSWGISKAASLGSTGTGPSQHQDLMVVKYVDKSSPRLYLACAQGARIVTATLEAVRPVGITAQIMLPFLDISLTDVIVSSVKPSGSVASDALPTEAVTFNYAKIKWTYKRYNPAGALQEIVITMWNLLINRPAAARPDVLQLE